MKLIVWLGNPGKEYSKNRHNIGFMIIDEFCAWNKIGSWKHEKWFSADIIKYGDIIYCKPLTYMNKSWEAIKKIIDFYKIPVENILIVHDEIDLSTWVIQKKLGGSHAGHNGIKSAITMLGDNTFTRLRVGVDRPATKEEVVDYVLGDFSKQELDTIKNKEEIIFNIINEFIKEQ
jgi:peptidyl-tRNA hydrolase, PTH1 family